MKKVIIISTLYLLCFLFAAAFSSVVHAEMAEVVPLGNDILMDRAEFGTTKIIEWTTVPIGFRETDKVPLVEGTNYLWRIHLIIQPERQVTYREELIYPGGLLTREKTTSPQDGWIWGAFSVVSGDPEGEYAIRVYIQGRLAKVFRFTVFSRTQIGEEWSPTGDGGYIHVARQGRTVYIKKCQRDALRRHHLPWAFSEAVYRSLLNGGFSAASDGKADIAIHPFHLSQSKALVDVIDSNYGKHLAQPRLTEENFNTVLQHVMSMVLEHVR